MHMDVFTYPAPLFTLFTAGLAGRTEDLAWELSGPGKTAIKSCQYPDFFQEEEK